MIKIVYIVSTLEKCGPTTQLFNIIKNLDRSFFEPYLITLSPDSYKSKRSDFELLKVSLISLNLSRIAGFFLAGNIVSKIISKIEPHLIHTQGVRADFLSSRLRTDIPRISTIRNFPQKDFLMTYGYMLGRFMVCKQVSALRRMSLCVGVSRAVSDNLRNNFSLKNSMFITNGVDTEYYFPSSNDEKRNLRAVLNLPQDVSICISSGDLSDRKDPFFLINAWKKFFAGNYDLHLVILGGGALESECELAARGAVNIHVIGVRSNVDEYLKASDYYVSSSKAEGMPNSALEALSCGLPVILSDIGPHSELLRIGNVGYAYSLGNYNSFYDCLVKIIAEDDAYMRSSCPDIIRTNFSAEVMSRNYQLVYKRIIGVC